MRIFLPLILVIIFFACAKKETVNTEVKIEGDLVDEISNTTFNPYINASVFLYDEAPTLSTVPVASAHVDEKGHYLLTTNHQTGVNGYLSLNTESGTNYGYGATYPITIKNELAFNFIIPCNAVLNRKIINQTGTKCDSALYTITNSHWSIRGKNIDIGTRNIMILSMKGKENNYIVSKFYRSGTFTQRIDTIHPDCSIALNDSIFY